MDLSRSVNLQRQDLGESRRGAVCKVHLKGRSKERCLTGERHVPPSKETLLSPRGNIASYFNPTECSPVQSPIVLEATFFLDPHLFLTEASKK